MGLSFVWRRVQHHVSTSSIHRRSPDGGFEAYDLKTHARLYNLFFSSLRVAVRRYSCLIISH